MAEVNNSKAEARNFYLYELATCSNCGLSGEDLYHVKGKDFLLCKQCLTLTLEELDLVEDFFSSRQI